MATEIKRVSVGEMEDQIMSPSFDLKKLRDLGLEVEAEEDVYIDDVLNLCGSSDKLVDYINCEESVRVFYEKDGKCGEYVISNRDLINWVGTACDGYYVYTDGRFLYAIISKAAGQAAWVGIWDVECGGWVFRNHLEGVCPEAIIYVSDKLCFIGYSVYCYPYIGPSGDDFFIIESGKLEFYEVKDGMVVDKSLLPKKILERALWGGNNFLLVDSERNFIYLQCGDEVKKYRFPGVATARKISVDEATDIVFLSWQNVPSAGFVWFFDKYNLVYALLRYSCQCEADGLNGEDIIPVRSKEYLLSLLEVSEFWEDANDLSQVKSDYLQLVEGINFCAEDMTEEEKILVESFFEFFGIGLSFSWLGDIDESIEYIEVNKENFPFSTFCEEQGDECQDDGLEEKDQQLKSKEDIIDLLNEGPWWV